MEPVPFFHKNFGVPKLQPLAIYGTGQVSVPGIASDNGTHKLESLCVDATSAVTGLVRLLVGWLEKASKSQPVRSFDWLPAGWF